MGASRILGVVFGATFSQAPIAMTAAEKPPPAAPAVEVQAEMRLRHAPRPGSLPSAARVIYGFFDDHTGDRIGRLRIERVRIDFQHSGFLKLAWRPVAVLEGVTLDIASGAPWPAAGEQIINAINDGGRAGCMLRDVRLKLEGSPLQIITARSGRLRSDGGLELTGTTLSLDSSLPRATGDLCWWLAGPQAGRLTPIPAAMAATSPRASSEPVRAAPIER